MNGFVLDPEDFTPRARGSRNHMVLRKIPFNYAQAHLLAVLALINFVNFADRQVLNPLVPLLRAHFGVSDAQLGSLQMVLLVVLALAIIPSGYLADRFNEPKIIATGVIFWSLAAIASGLRSLLPGLGISTFRAGS